MLGYFLVGGTINAIVLSVIAFLLSRFAGDIYGRSLLVIFLFIAGGAYVSFAVGAEVVVVFRSWVGKFGMRNPGSTILLRSADEPH